MVYSKSSALPYRALEVGLCSYDNDAPFPLCVPWLLRSHRCCHLAVGLCVTGADISSFVADFESMARHVQLPLHGLSRKLSITSMDMFHALYNSSSALSPVSNATAASPAITTGTPTTPLKSAVAAGHARTPSSSVPPLSPLRIPTSPFPRIGFVDVEGQGADDSTYDTLLTLPLLLSSKVVLYNHKGAVLASEMLSRLAVLASAANYVDGKDESVSHICAFLSPLSPLL